MIENKVSLIFMEGPQGTGKTCATEYASSLGYRTIRGICDVQKLITNTTSLNWFQSLMDLENLVNCSESYVSDRSFWSLVVFKMRQRPDLADTFYSMGSRMFRKKIGDVDHKIVVIFANPEICVERANPDSPVSITDITESENENIAYKDLLKKLRKDNFNTYSIENIGITKEEFLEQIKVLLS